MYAIAVEGTSSDMYMVGLTLLLKFQKTALEMNEEFLAIVLKDRSAVVRCLLLPSITNQNVALCAFNKALTFTLSKDMVVGAL